MCLSTLCIHGGDGNIIIIVSNHLQEEGMWFVAPKQTAFILLLVVCLRITID